MAETYRYGQRGVLEPGDVFRVSGGPEWRGRRMGRRGRFQFRGVYRRRSRVYLEAAEFVDGQAGCEVLLFVSGPAHYARGLESIKWRMRPYRVRKCRRST